MITLNNTITKNNLNKLDENFWSERYSTQQTGWDVGMPSRPIREYTDGLENKTSGS
ncbi:MAG: hypothetical protein R3A12_08525 [Ignavibacteria bacterium]